MNEYQDGLNFVPILAKQSPMSSARTRLSCSRSDMNGSVLITSPLKIDPYLSYEGNYEGDLSMFPTPDCQKFQHFNSFERDSNEVLNTYGAIETFEPPTLDLASVDDASQMMRMWNYYKYKWLAQDSVAQVSAYTEKIQESFYFQKMCALLGLGATLLLWLLRFIIYCLGSICNLGLNAWKSRFLLRNSARRILWWMTLAKCGDRMMFMMILLLTPLLFIIGLLGFLISLYSEIKEWITRWGDYMRGN